MEGEGRREGAFRGGLETDLAGDLELGSSLPSLPGGDVLHGQPQGLDDVHLLPFGLQHVAGREADSVSTAHRVLEGVVLAGEARRLPRAGEGDDLPAPGLTHRRGGGVVCVRMHNAVKSPLLEQGSQVTFARTMRSSYFGLNNAVKLPWLEQFSQVTFVRKVQSSHLG